MNGSMVRLTVDGAEVSAPEGRSLIEAIRKTGVQLPALCYHPSLEAYGACRLCVVEVTVDGRTKLLPSCSTPVAERMVVQTDSEAAERARRLSMQLILARCSGVKSLWDYAAKMGVTDTPFEKSDEDCIMCGLCERVCRELVGKAVIAVAGRGAEREVRPPFDGECDVCIGCEACVAVCPTGKVKSLIEDGRLYMETWKTRLDLAHCAECGRVFAPEKLIEHVRSDAERLGIQPDLCPRCRGRSAAQRLRKATATPAGSVTGRVESEG